MLSVLSVGEGDVKFSFDKNVPAERARAAKIVQDMMRQGYALLVQVGKKDGKPLYQRATEFDPETCEYIVASTAEETIDIGKSQQAKARRTTRYAADTTPAVSVARSAGG